VTAAGRQVDGSQRYRLGFTVAPTYVEYARMSRPAAQVENKPPPCRFFPRQVNATGATSAQWGACLGFHREDTSDESDLEVPVGNL